MIFLDETGFMLQPNCRRTWAWRGRTPVQRVWFAHDRRSVIGCVGLSPARQRIEMRLADVPGQHRDPAGRRLRPPAGRPAPADHPDPGPLERASGGGASTAAGTGPAYPRSRNCRAMLRNSTRPSRSGTTPSTRTWPTSCRTTSRTWPAASACRSTISRAILICSDPTSRRPNSAYSRCCIFNAGINRRTWHRKSCDLRCHVCLCCVTVAAPGYGATALTTLLMSERLPAASSVLIAK